MKTKQGFTLIELLVVVLIIGILAAVALPQYQKAVEKARVTEAIIQVRALAEAEKEYYLANGSYADTFDKLSFDFPGTLSADKRQISQKNIYLSLTQISDPSVYAGSNRNQYKNGLWYIGYDLTTNILYCVAKKIDDKSNSLCKTYQQTPIDCPWTSVGNTENCYPI